MQFFYFGDYPDPSNDQENEEAPLSALELHAEMYAIGDKYQAPGLSRLAVQKYKDRLKSSWTQKDLLRSIAKVYYLTPESKRDLRDVTVQHVRSKMCYFQSNDAERIHFRGICLEVPEFSLDVLQAYIDCPQGRSYRPIK